jgi:hypothetical protein
VSENNLEDLSHSAKKFFISSLQKEHCFLKKLFPDQNVQEQKQKLRKPNLQQKSLIPLTATLG